MAVLTGRGAALLFEKPSARTRNSTELAVVALGGHPVYIQGLEVGIDTRETAEDVARTLACYHAVICARVLDHEVLVRMVRALDGPLAEGRGLRPEAARYDGPAEHLQDVWIAVRASLRSVLERVNLEDVVQGRLPRSVAKLTEDPDAWAPPRGR